MFTEFLNPGEDIVCRRLNLRLDRSLLISTGVLILFGLVMVTSASLHLGERKMGNAFYFPLRQVAHVVAGLVMAGGVSMVPLRLWERAGQWLFLAGLALLVAVLIPGVGVQVKGAMRWLEIAGVRVQVSEIVKLISVIYMAGYITRHVKQVRTTVMGLIRPLLLLAFAGLLLLLEPDFGATFVIIMTALGMMFLGGARIWQFALLMTGLGLMGLVLILASDYRRARLMSFLDPWADAEGKGFQLIQALIAFGRGDWFGVGLGSGIQKLFYLPEGHTDFLFAVIAEELGFIGVCVIIALYSLIILRAFEIARIAETGARPFAAFLAYGIGIWIGLQAFINMGVNMGILPTKGLTLPLMSYGGGSMVVTSCAIALLFRVHSEVVPASTAQTGGQREWQSE